METEKQPQDVVVAAVAMAVAAASSLGGAGADDNNKNDGSTGPQICCHRSNTALAREVRTQVDSLLLCIS
jgi:hypothetical protein